MYNYYVRHYDKAIDKGMKTLELDPNFNSVHRLLSLCYQGKGMFDQAIKENEIWGKHTGNEVKTKVALAQIYAAAGQMPEARKLVDELNAVSMLSVNDYRGMALIYAALGENDLAFEWLEKAFAKHEEELSELKINAAFDTIRSDVRFKDLLRRIGLPE